MCPICPRRNPNLRNKHGARIQYCKPNGPTPAPILLVMDAPDDNANRQGLTCVGKLGREVVDCYLPAAGLDRDQVLMTYAMRCQRPDGDSPTVDEGRACSEFWLRESGGMEQLRPQVVIAAGGVAAKVAVGREESGRMDVGTYHGQLYGKVEYERAPELQPHTQSPWWWKFRQPTVFGVGGDGRPAPHLIVTNSPASGFAGSDLMTHVLDDFRAVAGILQSISQGVFPHRLDQHPFPTYREITSPTTVLESLKPGYSATRGRWVAVDTETDGMDGPPWCLSYSTAPGTGFVIPADAREAIAAFNWGVQQTPYQRVLLHNAMFDVEVLERMGVVGYTWRDTMHTAYQLGNQPQGLKPLAWRLCGMEMQDYSEVVRGPSIPAVLEWGEKVRERVAKAIPTKLPRKKLVLEPHHKFWKKHAGLLGRRMVKLHDWQLAQLFPLSAGGDFPSPWDWWEEREVDVKQALTMFGGGLMPQESIVHVPRGRAIDYAGRDADATLRSWFELRRLVRQLAKVVPVGGERPRKTW